MLALHECIIIITPTLRINRDFFFSQHVDEAVNSQLKERFQDKMTRLQKGEKKMFEDMFAYACPKFISPIPPDYDSLPENYNKVGRSGG